MRLSLLVPTYRRPEALKRCLKSALAQTRPPDELIVIVRADDYETKAVASRLFEEAAGTGITCFHATVKEPGLINAQNAGLAVATGDVVCFTDDDVVLPPTWLARIEEHFERDSVGAVGGRDRLMYAPPRDETAQVVGRLTWFGRMIGNHHKVIPGGPRAVDHLKGCNMSFRRILSPRLDPNLIGVDGTELDMCLRIRKAGAQVIYDPDLVVEHYPAPRENVPERETFDAILGSAHNLAYCVWKHLPLWRRLSFLVYTLIVGQGDCYGLAKFVIRAPKDGVRLAGARLRACVGGTLRGIARACSARRQSEPGGTA